MSDQISIGDFSRMTQLTVKTLRHYHEVGLVVPDRIDPATGYRYYTAAQLPTAQVVRRLRDLRMPIADVRAVLAADPVGRNVVISDHLDRLESELAATRSAVEALRAIVAPAELPHIEHRSLPETRVIAISASVDRDDIVAFWAGAVAELQSVDATPDGPVGALYGFEVFAADHGDVTVFIPVRGTVRTSRRVRDIVIPAVELAVVRHRGPHDDVDIAYSALGEYATRHEISVDGPLREHYHRFAWDTEDSADWETELCWPIFRSDAGY